MAQLLTQLTDFSTLGGTGLTGQSLTDPYEVLMRLGWTSLGIWGLQSAGVDQQIEGFLAQYLPPNVSMAMSTAVTCGISDIASAAARRAVMNIN
jgi:hypothetical protein